ARQGRFETTCRAREVTRWACRAPSKLRAGADSKLRAGLIGNYAPGERFVPSPPHIRAGARVHSLIELPRWRDESRVIDGHVDLDISEVEDFQSRGSQSLDAKRKRDATDSPVVFEISDVWQHSKWRPDLAGATDEEPAGSVEIKFDPGAIAGGGSDYDDISAL